MKRNMEILVASFDGYSDIWSTFVEIFKKNWPDCSYKIRMISNYLDCEGIDTIKTGEEVDWSTRMLKALNEVNEEYVLLLLEDYLIGKKVDSYSMRKILYSVIDEKMNYCRLTNFPRSRFTVPSEKYVPLYEDEEYAINLQAAIWKVSYLKDLLKKYPGNAWEFEVGILSESVKAEHVVLKGCYTMLEDPLNIVNGVLKGKWFPSAIKYFEKNGITIDTKNRKLLSRWQVIKYDGIQIVKNSISYDSRKKLKKIARVFGVKFMSKY